MPFTDDDLIYSYSRAQAIEDGVLIDVTATASEAGFRLPVAVTDSVWAIIDEIPDDCGEEPSGRLRDVLSALFHTVRGMSGDADTLKFHVLMTRITTTTNVPVPLKAVSGPGDEGEPVITIMLPNED